MEGPHQHSNVQQLRSNTIKISKTYQQANLKKIENDTKIEMKEKICTSTSQNGVTKKCSI